MIEGRLVKKTDNLWACFGLCLRNPFAALQLAANGGEASSYQSGNIFLRMSGFI